jgi:hypothetical protein
MARKRRPGGGRKPASSSGAAKHFNTRIAPDVRRRLEQEAERNNRTLSREIESRLRESVEFPDYVRKRFGNQLNYALAHYVAEAAKGIDLRTGKSWRNDAYSGQALRMCVDIILRHVTNDGPIDIPEPVRQSAEAFARAVPQAPPEQIEFYKSPAGAGQSVALGLIDQLQMLDTPPPNQPGVYYADHIHLMPKLGKLLRVRKERDKS